MQSIKYMILMAEVVFCAYRAVVSKRILSVTIFLASISALVSIVLYLLGAAQVAVIELSVGAGLVTVLLVYALSVVGDDALDPASVIPKPLAIALVGADTIVAVVGLALAVQVRRRFRTLDVPKISTLRGLIWRPY